MSILQSLLSNLPQILIAFLVFGLLIFFHELGHFSAAKWSKIKVNEFAMGMGPTLWSMQKGETVYALRLFPIGGFCAMEGEDEDSRDPRAFNCAPLPKRMLVTVAGSLMNLLLGLIILLVMSANMPLIGTTEIVKFDDNATSSAQLQVGDIVKKINGHTVRTNNDMIYELTRDRDGIMNFEVDRAVSSDNNKYERVPLNSVTFKMDTVDTGVQIISIDFKVRGVEPTFIGIITNSFNWTLSIIKQVWGGFADLITGRYGFSQLSGPIGVTSAISQAASVGWQSLFMLVAFITINLGVFNLLPLPALDGGRLIFQLIEVVRKKPINPRYEGLVHGVGFMLLIGLMLIVTFNDVSKII